MLQSMTGYAGAQKIFRGPQGELEIRVEIRSVNSKFLDIQIRSPRSYLGLEQAFSSIIRQRLKRGRIEVFIQRRVLEGYEPEIHVNIGQTRKLASALTKVIEENSLASTVSLRDLLQFSDWLVSDEKLDALDQEKAHVSEVLDQALQQLNKERRAEGESLTKVISQHLRDIRALYDKIEPKSDALVQSLKERFRERLKLISSGSHQDPARLEQEIVLWVARADFQEEIDRLRHHLEALESLAEKTGELGRKMEFVLQEAHRELNTMGSKCVDVATTHEIIEMKALVERIREQIQNVE